MTLTEKFDSQFGAARNMPCLAGLREASEKVDRMIADADAITAQVAETAVTIDDINAQIAAETDRREQIAIAAAEDMTRKALAAVGIHCRHA